MRDINKDCRYFRGDIPCLPHKIHGCICENCPEYSQTTGTVLIIKLGAMGDVVRTTPLLHRFREIYPDKEIWWVTDFPDAVPYSFVDRVYDFSFETYIILRKQNFDVIYSLDKDLQAVSLCEDLWASKKFGFGLEKYKHIGKPAPINDLAVGKYMTGLFDDISKENKKSYLQEIFEICGLEFNGEEYIVDYDPTKKFPLPDNDRRVIGLNTGCGARWTSRRWANENWIKLAEILKDNGFFPVFIGGEQEDENNRILAAESDCYYPGYFDLETFKTLINSCETVVTGVTMAMHIAIGLKKRLVLINNIFNPNEFELYGRGEIVEPDKPCTCYFMSKCNNQEYKCMDTLPAEKVFQAVMRQMISNL